MVEYGPGAADPVHRHDAYAFVFVLEGSVVMQVEGGDEVVLEAGGRAESGNALWRNGTSLLAETGGINGHESPVIASRFARHL